MKRLTVLILITAIVPKMLSENSKMLSRIFVPALLFGFTLAQSQLTINFNRTFTGVAFNTFVTLEDHLYYGANKAELDVLPLLEKVHTRFDKILMRMEDHTPDSCSTTNMPIAAKHNANLKGTTHPLDVWLRLDMYRFEPDDLNFTHCIQTLHDQTTLSNKIFPGTISVILLDYTWMEYFEKARNFTNDLTSAKKILGDIVKIGVALSVDANASFPADFPSLNIPEVLSAADVILFTIFPITTYMEQVHDESHVKYFIKKFQDIKNTVSQWSPIPVVFVTGWPDTTLDGYRSYTHQVEFWRGIGKWAEDTKTMVFLANAFDDPTGWRRHWGTIGWWRLVPNGSYNNSRQYIFDDKLTLSKGEVRPTNPRKNMTLLRPNADVEFSREKFIFSFDPIEGIVGENSTIFAELIGLAAHKFGKILLSLGIDEKMSKSLETFSKAIANLKVTQKNEKTIEMMVMFSGSDFADGRRGFENAIKYAEVTNSILPGTVKTVVAAGDFDEKDVELFYLKDSTNPKLNFGRVFYIDECFSISVQNIINQLAQTRIVKFFIFRMDIHSEFTLLGVEREISMMTSILEKCKHTIHAVNDNLEVVFLTSWADKDENEVVNYAETVNYWEEINQWAIRTGTKVIIGGAPEDDNKFGWWLIQSNRTESEHGHFKEKKAVVRDLLIGKA